MPIINASTISSLAVELLARSLVLGQTVSRVPGSDYRGSGGRTTIRVPQRRTAREQENPGDGISYVAIDETPVNVDLSHWYDATRVSDEDLTLSITAFGRQVLRPMIAAVAEAGEDQLANTMDAVAPTITLNAEASAADTRAKVLEAREELTSADVPAGRRFLACSPQVATRLFSVPDFVRANESGSTSAIRDAILGKLFGMTVIESNGLAPGTASAYHESGFALATLSPAIPEGAASAASATEQGISLRTVFDFDPGILSDVVAVSTFGGAALVDADRVVGIDTEGS